MVRHRRHLPSSFWIYFFVLLLSILSRPAHPPRCRRRQCLCSHLHDRTSLAIAVVHKKTRSDHWTHVSRGWSGWSCVFSHYGQVNSESGLGLGVSSNGVAPLAGRDRESCQTFCLWNVLIEHFVPALCFSFQPCALLLKAGPVMSQPQPEEYPGEKPIFKIPAFLWLMAACLAISYPFFIPAFVSFFAHLSGLFND